MQKAVYGLIVFFSLIIIGTGITVYSDLPAVSLLKDHYPTLRYDSEGERTLLILKKRMPWQWFSLKSIDSTAAHAIVVSEDWAFYQHFGFDLSQMKEAFLDALEGERLRGASTITQQLAKNLYLSSDRSLWRKFKELLIAIQMEVTLSKKRILELYLNIVEFGPGVYGIGPAADHYFKKSPAALSIKEGAFLAMLLPNPRQYSESFRLRELTPYAEKTINSIIIKMKQAHFITPEQKQLALTQVLPWQKQEEVSPEIEQDLYYQQSSVTSR